MNCSNIMVFAPLLVIAAFALSSCSEDANGSEEESMQPNRAYYHQKIISVAKPYPESMTFSYDSHHRCASVLFFSKSDTIDYYTFLYSPFKINSLRTKFEHVVLNQKGYIQEMMMTYSIEARIYHATCLFTYDSSDRLTEAREVLIAEVVNHSVTVEDTSHIAFVAAYSESGALVSTRSTIGSNTQEIRFEYKQPLIPNTKNQFTTALTFGPYFLSTLRPFMFAGLFGKASASLPSAFSLYYNSQYQRSSELTYDFDPDGSIKAEKVGGLQIWEYQ